MTEQAKKAAAEIARRVIAGLTAEFGEVPPSLHKDTASLYQQIIDAEFAEVVKKAEWADEHVSKLVADQKKIESLCEERDELKKALGELMENSKKAVSRCTHSEMTTTYAKNLMIALAAAEKLLEDK